MTFDNPQIANLLRGKKGLVIGIANDQSIAWGCAKAFHAFGAEVAVTYLNDKARPHVEPLARQIDAPLLLPLDVLQDGQIEAVFDRIAAEWGQLDFVLHSIAFSPREALAGRVTDVAKPGFLTTMDVSCWSFIRTAHLAEPLMKNGGTLFTMSYYGAQAVVENYNIMGVAKAALEASVQYLAVDLGGKQIRVNAISAGPIKTLAASGIGDFRYILKWNEYNSPLRRNVTIEDVGGAGAYLLSDLASGVTGEIHHVDAGYNVIGMKAEDAPDMSVV